jgi:hypothetical protein
MTSHLSNASAARRLDRVIRDPGLRAGVAYWDSLRGTRALPARMELDPAVLRPHLQDAAILEVSRPGSVRIRLGGARINALLGMDVRGLPLRALFDLSERSRIAEEVETAIGDGAVLVLDVVSPAPRFGLPERDGLNTQIVILPMTDADLAPTRALYLMGAVAGDIRATDPPHRWCATTRHRLQVRAGEPVLASAPLILKPKRIQEPPRDETASETRGPMARARFRVIEGGLS